MNTTTKYIGITVLALMLTSCDTTTQMTSGADYLSRYQPTYVTNTSSELDNQIRDIAAIEPDLRFPARIGLARIENGHLTSGPIEETQAWGDLAEKLGAPYGDFVPVSPFIADMVRPNAKRDMSNNSSHNVVADIRRASARQHLDYVLAYEVAQNTSDESNGLSFANLTVLGMYIIPSRNVKINSTASAILIDVRNGYPYGTASAIATDKQMRTLVGSGSSRRKAENNAYLLAVENLTDEVEIMMKDLWVQQSKQ
jgi:rhombotail lipoprotein